MLLTEFLCGQKTVKWPELATRPGIANFVTSVDPNEQNFKECVSF